MPVGNGIRDRSVIERRHGDAESQSKNGVAIDDGRAATIGAAISAHEAGPVSDLPKSTNSSAALG